VKQCLVLQLSIGSVTSWLHVLLRKGNNILYYLQAREPRREAYTWSESQDQILVTWSTGEESTMHILVVHAMIILLNYGPGQGMHFKKLNLINSHSLQQYIIFASIWDDLPSKSSVFREVPVQSMLICVVFSSLFWSGWTVTKVGKVTSNGTLCSESCKTDFGHDICVL